MTYTRNNKGVCSASTSVMLAADGTIEDIRVEYGCEGNLQGLCNLLRGMPAAEAAQRLHGIDCEGRGNSCPHQISLCLTEALAALAGAQQSAV